MDSKLDQLFLNVVPFTLVPPPCWLTWRLVIGCPGPEAVIGVEVHGINFLLPLCLLESHGGLVGGEDGGGETQAPVNWQPAKKYIYLPWNICWRKLWWKIIPEFVLNFSYLELKRNCLVILLVWSFNSTSIETPSVKVACVLVPCHTPLSHSGRL